MVRTTNHGHPLLVVAVVVFIMVIAGSAITAYLFLGWKPGQSLSGQTITTSSTNGNPIQGGSSAQGEIYGTVADSVTGTSLGGTSAKVDVINPDDLTKPIQTITVSTSAKTFTSSGLYTAGQVLLLHAYSTEGNGYYDAVETVTVPSSTVLIGNSQVFNLGTIDLVNRAAASSIQYTLYQPSGASLSAATGSTGSTSITSFTAPTKSFTVKYQISNTAVSTCWGCSFAVLQGSSNTFTQQTRGGMAWAVFNSTAINIQDIQNAGWTLMSNAPSGYLAFYKVIPAISSSSTTQASYTDSFTFDSSALASGTHVGLWLYFKDISLPSDAALGVADGAPSAVGAWSGYGISSGIGIGYTTPTRITATSAGGALLATVIITA